jgi:cobalt/nickel transport system ATP-binding protein
MSERVIIDLDNVYFSYPDGHEVLKGLSFRLHEGEKVALIGPNGAGKSTLMSHLNGVQLPVSGSVRIDGLEVRKENLKQIRRKVGIVFQDPDDQLFCPTVFDDVAFGPLNLGLPREEIEARVKEALAVVGLQGFEGRSSFHLSFGERKRLALATVLSYQPEILVFDEPSTNMDPMNRRNLINWLKTSDRTILLCTHDLDIALEVCHRCLLLVDGRIIADGPSAEILYDRQLLEENKLELPLAVMTHELLHDILAEQEMDEGHRTIISHFLHAHRHAHGTDAHLHVHVHAHDHDHAHLHEEVDESHFHDADERSEPPQPKAVADHK